jgi:hypothetical protein
VPRQQAEMAAPKIVIPADIPKLEFDKIQREVWSSAKARRAIIYSSFS